MMVKEQASTPPSKQSKVKLWRRKVLNHVKAGENTVSETYTSTSTISKSTVKTTGWKLRSPLSRRSPPKQNPAQAAEIEKLKEALKAIESQPSNPEQQLGQVEIEALKAENQRLEEYKVAVARLAKEKLESQPKTKQLEAENNNLRYEKQRLEPLVQVGIAVRCRFYDTYRKATDPTSGENTEVIRNGNGASQSLKSFE